MAHFDMVTVVRFHNSCNGTAFYGDVSLQSISVQLGNTAFSSHEGVLFNYPGSTLVAFPASWGTSYALEENVTHIGAYAFSYAIKNIKKCVPNNVRMSVGKVCA